MHCLAIFFIIIKKKLFFLLVDILFLKDLCMRFFLMYYDANLHTWISNRKRIRNNYLTGWYVLLPSNGYVFILSVGLGWI